MNKDPRAFIVLVVIVLFVVVKSLRLTTLQQVKQSIRKLPSSFKYRNDFKLRAPKDRLYVVNYILLTLAGVFLIHIEEEDGIITGNENNPMWIAKKRFRTSEFDNPINFTKKLVPLVKDITDNVKEDLPIYTVVVFNNRTNIKNVNSGNTPVIKANELANYINRFDKKELEQSDINVLLDELKRYRFDY